MSSHKWKMEAHQIEVDDDRGVCTSSWLVSGRVDATSRMWRRTDGKKKGNGVGVEKGVTKGDTDDGCRYVGKGWTVHGGGCANIDSF